MLTESEILQFINDDKTSEKKINAWIGERYYRGEHDILHYELYYFDADGNLVKDETRSNIKIPHPFFTEIVDQAAQYALASEEPYIKSDIPELQEKLNMYFNDNEDFNSELYELLAGAMTKGFDNMFAYKKEDGITAFAHADSLGVVEVRAKDTDSNTENVIYWYIDRIEKGQKKIKRIQVWDDTYTYFYVQTDEGKLEKDTSEPINPRPHVVKIDQNGNRYDGGGYGYVPFFRLDNNKKQRSDLANIKLLIDDYDLMNCGLSNNIQDASEYLVVVKGFQGDNLEQLIKNVKTKKHIGVDGDDGGDVDFKTVDIPYEARRIKLEVDEKNIYRFGMALNTSSLKDTTATTNIAIKAAYSLLDLKVSKLILKLKQFLRKLIKVVLDEINELEGKDYQQKDVYFNFKHEIMSNALENAQIELTEAQKQQTAINTLLGLATHLDNETLIQLICEELDISYEDIKSKLPDPNEAVNAIAGAENVLNSEVGGAFE